MFLVSFTVPFPRHRRLCIETFRAFSPGCEAGSPSPGRLFMTDLLVSSLMADGGLETALRAAVKGMCRPELLGCQLLSPFYSPGSLRWCPYI